MPENKVKARSYSIYKANGSWLGQVVITSDGFFAVVSDYGSGTYTWRHYGEGDFRKFLVGLNEPYFAGKLTQGMSYMIFNKKFTQACERLTKEILPALQEVLRESINTEPEF